MECKPEQGAGHIQSCKQLGLGNSKKKNINKVTLGKHTSVPPMLGGAASRTR